ncbi:MAG: Eco57I restriction-modification methylase domain-containing protein [Phycisphaerae bacterium]
MPTLATDLRNKLERVVIDARDEAEAGAHAALEALAVHHYEPYTHMKPPARELRNHLRARARQLGDRKLPKPDANGKDHEIDHLAGECAYEHWHRMLFARFLAENGLLIEPEENMAISLAEAEELAKEEKVDVWVYASRCAQRMLPQIFRPDDPLLQVSLATEHMLKLEKLLASLPAAVFTASDALGWVYQFWQSKKKDEVNRSEVKIGADEISAVTQLFTEPYMVEFLLHNTLGAWWAGKRLKADDGRLKAAWEKCQTEEDCRRLLALPGVTWDYLRFVKVQQKPQSETSAYGLSPSALFPAAGTFDGWPRAAREIKVLDPCCGSGHFLVAALHHLVPIRMFEEGLSAADAVDAVLRDNLHGLEIDERCCQIAAFALAFAAWTYPKAGGYRQLPDLHIACTGIGPQSTAAEWLKLAEQSGIPMPAVGREAIKNGLLNLHRLFSLAPTLGSLINPKELPADLIAADYETIQPYLTAIMKAEQADDETRERAIAAAGMVKAADLLAGDYTLVITNVPYLGTRKQGSILKSFIDRAYPLGKEDLATAFLQRSLHYCAAGGSIAMVTPQNWLFLTSYAALRMRLLRESSFNAVAKLGEGGFQSTQAAGAFTALVQVTRSATTDGQRFLGIDASEPRVPEAKASILASERAVAVDQSRQLKNPDAVISIEDLEHAPLLGKYADGLLGSSSADNARFRQGHWEQPVIKAPWVRMQSTPNPTTPYAGREFILAWGTDGDYMLTHNPGCAVRGTQAWRRNGVAVARMRQLPCTLYTGEVFDDATAIVMPQDQSLVPAIWAFCCAQDYRDAVRKVNQKVSVANATLVKVPFDLDHWQKVAAKKYPGGLPEPESDDPTQWLFHGRPDEAQEGTELQVAVARLLGYRWPAELDDKMPLSKRAQALAKKCGELAKFADNDGIVCLPAVRGEDPAADRLLKLLAACDIELESDFDLDDWLRNGFFEEHCKLFHDRPFVWHIWDGRKRDGFHALVNYHKLAEGGGKGRRLLENLTYAYLGEWITRQKDGVKRGEGGAEDRLAAAVELQKRLEAILAGEPPFDIFVRWKPLAEQPIGWEPDINDGVRVNIRPFLASDLPLGGRTGAGILRYKPNIKWTKDRGKEPQRPRDEYPWFWGWDEKTEDFAGGKTFDGNRHNDCHYSTKVKQAARDAAKTKERKK